MNRIVIILVVKIVIAAAAIVCAFIFAINPLLEKLLENQVEISEMNEDLQIAEDKLSQLKAIDKEKENLASTKEIVSGYLPDDADPSKFIVDLERATSQIPVVIDSLSVTESKSTKTTKTSDSSDDTSSSKTTTSNKTTSDKTLDFTATFKSNYDNILIFFQQMETFSRFNTIESVSISGYSEQDGNLSLKVQGKLYYGK